MPELPEVETIRRGLAAELSGARLIGVEVRDPRLRQPVPTQALQDLVGTSLVDFRRRAKYLLIDTDDRSSMIVHLGMSGSITAGSPSAALHRHDHVRLQVALAGARREIRFRDPRRFGLLLVAPTDELTAHPLLAHLGPEPLDPAFDAGTLRRRARGRRQPVKAFLMDARTVVGVGNIYASEALWRAGVHPGRAAGRIGARRWERIHEAIREVLTDALAAGGTTLRDYRGADGDLGYFAVDLEAYGREGEACSRCGRPLRRVVISGRSTFYCPGCQH